MDNSDHILFIENNYMIKVIHSIHYLFEEIDTFPIEV
jgi:hypothetical protein